jgi:probable F420-dependent oxidoreductase
VKRGLILTGGSARADVELACRAERAGLDGVFSIEFFNRHGYVALAATAARTERIALGTAIANAFTRTPLLHASAAMDLDELSGGRFVLGLGSGTRRMNEDWYGVPFERPAARIEELVDLLRAAFRARTGGGFRFDGQFWKLRVPAYARPGAARESVPIWVAGLNRGMVRAAGRVADGMVGHPIATRRWHAEVTLPSIRAGERDRGRPEGACALVPYVVTSLASTREEAVRDAKGQIGFYYTTELYHSVLEHHGWKDVGDACRKALQRFDVGAMIEAVPDALVDEIAIACTPDEAHDRLAQWKGLTDYPLLYAPTVGIRPERVAENMDAILETFGSPAR